MKKYQTSVVGTRWGASNPVIRTLEVERESKKSIWVNGNCIRKRTSFDIVHNTFAEAKSYLFNKQEMYISSLESRRKNAKDKLAEIENLTE